jgi:hypothetical protein
MYAPFQLIELDMRKELTSGRYAPPYRVTSLTIWARSLASSTTKTWPSILRCEKSAVTAVTYVVVVGLGELEE